MKRTLLLITALLTVSLSAYSQVQCGFDYVHGQLKLTDPEYAQGLLDMADGMQLLQEGGYLNHSNNPSRAIRTIPVVVHVVLNTQAKHNAVTDAMIRNMVTDASKYFRKMVSDTVNIRSAFKPVATDCQIELCLAQRDPSGNATTGITRFTTTVASFAQGNDMKSASTGGVNPWNQQKYLNIWVVDLTGSGLAEGGGTGGYAYLPTVGMPGSAIDGIVLEYEVGFWSAGSTLAHETGHYLGLNHTWGENEGCSNSTYASGYDDGFSDTPNSSGPNMNQNCGTTVTSCSGTPAPGDQYENIMDYSNCPVMFTAQQSSLMNIILNGSGLSSPFTGDFGYRSSLVNNNNACVPPNGPSPSFTASSTGICTGSTVTYTNTTIGATSVSWSFPGGTPSTSSSTTTVTVTYPTAGTYNVSLTATNSDGSNTTTQSNYITVSGAGSAAALPLVEGFENTTFPPSGWTLDNIGSDAYTWARYSATNGGGYGTSSATARVRNYNYNGANTTGPRDWLITPAYDFSSASSGKLKFDYAHKYYGTGYSDSLQIFYSACGGAWNSIWVKGGTDLATISATGGNAEFIPTSAQWKTDSVSLSFLAGQPSVRFAFVNISRYGNDTYIDNVNLYNGAPPSTGNTPVANFVASNTNICAGSTVSFTDQSTNTPTSWSWTFAGGTPSTSNAQSPTVTYNTAGTYTVTLTAANGAGSDVETKTNHIVVTKPTITPSVNNASCGLNNGSATISTSAVNPTYAWNIGGNTATKTGLGAGTYAVTVTDNSGCSATAVVSVAQTGNINTSYSANPATGGQANGSAVVSASGGMAPLTYSWNNGTTGNVNNGIPNGTYTCTVTDANGCSVEVKVDVGVSGIETIKNIERIGLYPNPAHSQIKLDIEFKETVKFSYTIYDAIGRTVFQSPTLTEKTYTNIISVNDWAEGVYTIQLRTPSESETFKFIKQ